MFATLLNLLGSFSAAAGTKASVLWWSDEPKMPRSMLNK